MKPTDSDYIAYLEALLEAAKAADALERLGEVVIPRGVVIEAKLSPRSPEPAKDCMLMLDRANSAFYALDDRRGWGAGIEVYLGPGSEPGRIRLLTMNALKLPPEFEAIPTGP